jgi:hypothetical protein
MSSAARYAMQPKGGVAIPDHLAKALRSSPPRLYKSYLLFAVIWLLVVVALIVVDPLGLVRNVFSIVFLLLPFFFAMPVLASLTIGKPARELSLKIKEETGCDTRMERAIYAALKTAPWSRRTPSYELIVNVEEDQLYVHRKLTFAEDLSSVTIGPVTRTSNR